MKYKKAQNVLPEEILELIQNYVDGEYLYIPRKFKNKKSWGELSGTKLDLRNRNLEIAVKYKEGCSIKELAKIYFLSESSIRRIIREYNY